MEVRTLEARDGVYPVIGIHLSPEERAHLIQALVSWCETPIQVLTFRQLASGQIQFILTQPSDVASEMGRALFPGIEAQLNRDEDIHLVPYTEDSGDVGVNVMRGDTCIANYIMPTEEAKTLGEALVSSSNEAVPSAYGLYKEPGWPKARLVEVTETREDGYFWLIDKDDGSEFIGKAEMFTPLSESEIRQIMEARNGSS
jgi:hypothetical protein